MKTKNIKLHKTDCLGLGQVRYFTTPYGFYYSMTDLCRLFHLDYDDIFDYVGGRDELKVWTFNKNGLGIRRTFITGLEVDDFSEKLKNPLRNSFLAWESSLRDGRWFVGNIPEGYFDSVKICE